MSKNFEIALNSWIAFLSIILSFYILPVLLLISGIIPFSKRFYVLVVVALVLGFLSSREKITFYELGMTRCRLWEALRSLAPLTLTLISAMLLIFALGINKPIIYGSIRFYLFYIFLSAPLQEFIYRSYLTRAMENAGLNQSLKLIVSSALYSFLHIIYVDLFTLLATFLLGLYWGSNYNKFRNWYAVSISHSILGAFSILLGYV